MWERIPRDRRKQALRRWVHCWKDVCLKLSLTVIVNHGSSVKTYRFKKNENTKHKISLNIYEVSFEGSIFLVIAMLDWREEEHTPNSTQVLCSEITPSSAWEIIWKPRDWALLDQVKSKYNNHCTKPQTLKGSIFQFKAMVDRFTLSQHHYMIDLYYSAI